MTVGERIKQLRKQHGWTQYELADQMGYRNKSAICKIEKGEWVPSYKLLKRYAQALNTTPEDLMGLSEGMDIVQRTVSIMQLMDEDSQKRVLSYAKYIMENHDGI